jgi:thioredoxin 1
MEVNDKNYNKLVLKEKRPIFIDFYSPNCAPCQQLKTFIKNEFQEYAKNNNVLVLTCDISKNEKIADKFKIRSVPFTIMITKDKEFKDPQLGLQDPYYYYNLIDKYNGKKKESFFKRLFS